MAHASALGSTTLLPVYLFGGAWLLFRDGEGRARSLADSCAHRACPLSLGKNVGGRVQCPYRAFACARAARRCTSGATDRANAPRQTAGSTPRAGRAR